MADSSFNYAGAKAAGYSDQEIAEYLVGDSQAFNLSGAVDAGYGYDEIVNYLVGTPAPTPEPPIPEPPVPESTTPGFFPQAAVGVESGIDFLKSVPSTVETAFDAEAIQNQSKAQSIFEAIDGEPMHARLL